MTIHIPQVDQLEDDESVVRTVDGVLMVTLTFHEAWVDGLRDLYTDDIAWARRVAAERGVDLDALAGSDPSYRAKYRK